MVGAAMGPSVRGHDTLWLEGKSESINFKRAHVLVQNTFFEFVFFASFIIHLPYGYLAYYTSWRWWCWKDGSCGTGKQALPCFAQWLILGSSP
jgi:hypothetical protein